jgi:hypothetical protein
MRNGILRLAAGTAAVAIALAVFPGRVKSAETLVFQSVTRPALRQP